MTGRSWMWLREIWMAVLDGISETVYENTVSVAQLKSTTGPSW